MSFSNRRHFLALVGTSVVGSHLALTRVGAGCEDCGGVDATENQAGKRSESDVEMSDLTAAVQEAVYDTTSSPELEQFLSELSNLSELVNATRVAPVYLDVTQVTALGRCIKVKLGESPLPNQTRLHKHGDFDYRYETRSQKWEVFAEICHPDINDFRQDVIDCCVAAAVVAVIVAVVSESPQAGYAVFYPTFLECLKSKIGNRAREVTVRLSKEQEVGCWTNHCR